MAEVVMKLERFLKEALVGKRIRRAQGPGEMVVDVEFVRIPYYDGGHIAEYSLTLVGEDGEVRLKTYQMDEPFWLEMPDNE